MSTFKTPNKRVALEPFPAGKELAVKGGLIDPNAVTQAGALTPLKVVFDSETYKAGTTVYVRSDAKTKTVWGKEGVFTLELPGYTTSAGQETTIKVEFILVPEDQIILVAA